MFPIRLPALRERADDLPALVWKFVDELAKSFNKHIESISKSNMEALQAYPWPGNIRELRNVVERAVIVATSPRLTIELPHSPPLKATPRTESGSLDEMARDHIRAVLERTGWRSVEIQQAGPTPQERMAALKQSMQESQAKIRQYEWIETTIISLKGEEKARTQKRCYYGADGKLQKLPMGGPPAAQPKPASGGRRGRVKAQIVENKKDDMKEYMERAAALVQQYVPPQPDDIQRARDAGKVTANPSGPGLVRLEFPDYLKPGDKLSIDVDAAANQWRGLSLASYLDGSKDAVVLAVQLGALADGTSYTSQTTLDAAAKNTGSSSRTQATVHSPSDGRGFRGATNRR